MAGLQRFVLNARVGDGPAVHLVIAARDGNADAALRAGARVVVETAALLSALTDLAGDSPRDRSSGSDRNPA